MSTPQLNNGYVDPKQLAAARRKRDAVMLAARKMKGLLCETQRAARYQEKSKSAQQIFHEGSDTKLEPTAPTRPNYGKIKPSDVMKQKRERPTVLVGNKLKYRTLRSKKQPEDNDDSHR